MVAGARRRRQDGVAARAALFMGVLLVIVMVQKVAFTPQKADDQSPGLSAARDPRTRRLLQAEEAAGNDTSEEHITPAAFVAHREVLVTSGNTSENGNATEETHICTPPAYHEFPPDAFTTEQRRNGALVLHIIMVIYMFTALAIVCDVYFVASLAKICEKLNLSEDVAGATFMAAGSSAPELFTSVIGVFVAKGDVGVGTIVGSAVFNILFVIGICGLAVTQIVTLTWFPLLRDSTFYLLSVILLILSILDGGVAWYEATIMLLVYASYIVCMKFNRTIQTWAYKRIKIFGSLADGSDTALGSAADGKCYNTYVPKFQAKEMFKNEEHAMTPPSHPGLPADIYIPVDEYVIRSNRKLSFEDACFRFMKGRGFRGKSRFWAAACIIICERRKLLADPIFVKRLALKTNNYDADASYDVAMATTQKDEDLDLAVQWKHIPEPNDGLFYMLKWGVTLPLCVLLYYTVPDCRQKRWDRWFIVTFLMSILWIAIFSYVMVWMVALIGFTLGIPDSIMGITFLAAGTSVPDAMSSVMVARQGQGDMAVSNTLGSNVFDILIGLALPWFIQTVLVAWGDRVHINSNGMIFSVILLFLTVVISISAIHFGGWVLDKKLGVICLSSYAIFLTFSVMIEFNVFGYVNHPMCTE